MPLSQLMEKVTSSAHLMLKMMSFLKKIIKSGVYKMKMTPRSNDSYDDDSSKDDYTIVLMILIDPCYV